MDRLAVVKQLRAAGVTCLTRGQWGSVRPNEYIKRRSEKPMPPGPANYHFLHITVTGDTDTLLEAKAGAKQVESFGLSTPPMVSYQDLVTNEGVYIQGQDYGTKGTHTVNDKHISGFPHDLNMEGYAIALMQNVGDDVTDAQVRLVAMVCAARELAGFVKKGARILPHRMFAVKSCPGPKAVRRLAEMQALKDEFVRKGLPKKSSPKKPSRGAAVDKALNNLKASTKGSGRRAKLINEAIAELELVPVIKKKG